MVMVGADPDELDRAAARLRCAAEDIDQHARSLPLELQAVWWAGQVASRFVEALTGDYVPAMRSTTDFLRRAAQELTQQAAQQREASAASSGSLTGPPGSVPTSRSGDGPQVPAAELNGLSADLGRMRQADPGQQRLWWQGLTSTQQTWLLANRPGELTSLDGLPEAVRKQAQDHYSSSIVDKVMTEKATLEGSAAGIVKIFKVEGGFEAERTTFRNGEVALRLDLEAGGGLSVKAAEVLARAGFGGTFRFPSAEEADKFLAGLAHAAAPHGSDWWHALGGPRGLADDAARDVADYLGQHGNRLESSRLTGGVSGEVEIPGLKIEEGRGVIASMNGPAADNAGRVTVEASGYVTAEGGEKALTGAVATEIKAALEIDGATPKSVTFDFSLDGQVKLLEKVDGIKNALGGIANGTARVEFNLEDEQVKAAAMTVADAVKRGDVQGAVAALDDVMDRAEIVLQGNAGASAGALDADFDAFVVEAGLKETRLVNVVTVVKPPGGSFYQMDPDG